MIVGLMIPYAAIGIFNGLIIYHMLQHRRLRASMGGTVGNTNSDKAQR